jgi:hypothetical protein
MDVITLHNATGGWVACPVGWQFHQELIRNVQAVECHYTRVPRLPSSLFWAFCYSLSQPRPSNFVDRQGGSLWKSYTARPAISWWVGLGFGSFGNQTLDETRAGLTPALRKRRTNTFCVYWRRYDTAIWYPFSIYLFGVLFWKSSSRERQIACFPRVTVSPYSACSSSAQ